VIIVHFLNREEHVHDHNLRRRHSTADVGEVQRDIGIRPGSGETEVDLESDRGFITQLKSVFSYLKFAEKHFHDVKPLSHFDKSLIFMAF
jgi:hypothetical protein